MKRETMSSIQAIRAMPADGPPQLIEFVLNQEWIRRIEEQLG